MIPTYPGAPASSLLESGDKEDCHVWLWKASGLCWRFDFSSCISQAEKQASLNRAYQLKFRTGSLETMILKSVVFKSSAEDNHALPRK